VTRNALVSLSLLPIKLEVVFVSYLAIQRYGRIIFSERIEMAGDSTSKNRINVPIESIFNVKEQLLQCKKVK
jgi:hypothetical protein